MPRFDGKTHIRPNIRPNARTAIYFIIEYLNRNLNLLKAVV